MFQPAGGLFNHYLGEWGLGGDPTLWIFQESLDGFDRHDHGVVDARIQLPALPGGAPDHSVRGLRGRRPRRRDSLQQLWHITLPLLGRTTALVIVLQLIASLRIFDQYYLMAGGGSNLSPENVFIQYIYNSGFVGFRVGYASALSYILFFFILLVALVQFRLMSRKED